MWKNKTLTILRVIHTLILIPLVVYFFIKSDYKEHFQEYSHVEFKIFVTNIKLNIDLIFTNFVVYGVLLLAALFCLILGVPSIYLIFAINVLFNPYVAFVVVLLLDIVASFITHTFVRFIGLQVSSYTYENTIPISYNFDTSSIKSLILWMRIFPFFHLRFIDGFVALKQPNLGFVQILPYLICGSAVRFIIHTMWSTYLFYLIVDFRAFPDKDVTYFLLITFIEMLNFIFPLLPELAPIPSNFRNSIKEIAYS